MLPFRVIGYIICSIIIGIVYGPESGKISGCPQDLALDKGGNLIDNYIYVLKELTENVAGIAFICMFGWFGAIFPVLLAFPQEINIFFKV